MKAISRRICGVLLGLGVLGSIVPVVRADEMADWMAEQRRQDEECRRKAQEDREAQDRAYQQAQAEREASDRAYREAQAEREARDRWDQWAQQQREAQDKENADREARDKYWRDVQAARDEQAAWYKSREEERQSWESQRKQQEWEEWMNRGREDWSAAGSTSTAPRTPGGWPAAVVILNPFALEKMPPKDQERVRQQATLTGQTILQEQQIIQNPFVRSPK